MHVSASPLLADLRSLLAPKIAGSKAARRAKYSLCRSSRECVKATADKGALEGTSEEKIFQWRKGQLDTPDVRNAVVQRRQDEEKRNAFIEKAKQGEIEDPFVKAAAEGGESVDSLRARSNILLAATALLFALSLFFTMSRGFLPDDLQNGPAIMD